MSKKLCAIHGVHSFRRCPKCSTQSARIYDKQYRNQKSNKFYHSKQWKEIRNIQLRQSPLCISCSLPAKVVDHIVEIKDGGEKLLLDNLQSMCISCHNIKTASVKKHRGGAVKSLQIVDTNTEPQVISPDKPFLGGTL